jgi:hypothetical protein
MLVTTKELFGTSTGRSFLKKETNMLPSCVILYNSQNDFSVPSPRYTGSEKYFLVEGESGEVFEKTETDIFGRGNMDRLGGA